MWRMHYYFGIRKFAIEIASGRVHDHRVCSIR
ncbi:hypothetical protein Goshw_013620 [Gossypium schwendimanii]|uniref:Uncharacterized protein n=1 Tax=Gossypium schwendimanii TaxID=34291 RepID=A0A7J9L360_GOSSC|nr:hypothetical protein [Gossypium schwendimanii]